MSNIKTPEDVTNLTDSERKHIPFVSINGNEVTVVCGYGIMHPMEADHHIVYIELFQNGASVGKKMLTLDDAPKAVFTVQSTENISAQALCNTHGIWQSL